MDWRAGGSSGDGVSEVPLELSLPAISSEHQPPPIAVICKVSERLRRVSAEQFAPQTMPIGPYYYQSEDSFFSDVENGGGAEEEGRPR